jgi:alpha,alpha-trehalase
MKRLPALKITLVFLCFFCIAVKTQAQSSAYQKTRSYIKAHWKDVIKAHAQDSGTLIGLPKPYNVPGIGSNFQEMYYWDTYFTNVGLIIDGHADQARNNVDNMIYLVKRYGFMPNGNRTFYLVRSQSPYLSMMIRDVYAYTHDKRWLGEVLPALETEYNFWMSKRITPTGLNHYSGDMAADDRKRSMFASADKRLKISQSLISLTDSLKILYGGHFIAECESGWDFTPRFSSQCADYLPVDLNCNLYMYEQNFAFFYSELGMKSPVNWGKVAQWRKKLIGTYLLNKSDGLYYDYNYKTFKHSTVLSAAIFNVLWSRVASKQDARKIVKNLGRLELSHGIAACEKGTRSTTYQWDSPNGWANLQHTAIAGLTRYGYKLQAANIAKKYADMVAKNFEATGSLWEKYNVQDGTLNAKNEYKLPKLMGWTAGVFIYCDDLLNTAPVKK